MRDVVIITIDSWREDSLQRMKNLNSLSEDWDIATGISHSSKTYLAFPTLLASSLPTSVYDNKGHLLSGVKTLPKVLQQNGYSTAAIVASNPNVQQWDGYFESFWNDGISDASKQYQSTLEKTRKRIMKTALMKKQVPAKRVAKRGKAWYESTSGPRFLWMHLMEPHFPYYPGLQKALEVGLFRSYSTIYDFHRKREDVAENHRDILQALYHKTVERLDEQIKSVLEFLDDDALIVITGDHGEEFQHGIATHDHLYDECVTVPFMSKNLPISKDLNELRHLDLAPTILNHINIEAPNEWEGSVARPLSSDNPVRMVNILGESVYTGVRTSNQKILKTIHADGSTTDEFYNLTEDPEEKKNLIDNVEPPTELKKELEYFIEEHQLDNVREDSREFISNVETDRLEELGYI